MRLSSHTLLGRVHGQARLEARHDVDALYALIDPAARASREAERDDEPERTLTYLRARVGPIRSAEVVEVEIVEAHRVSTSHGGRPWALVRSVVRYNGGPALHESSAIWVRDGGAWYRTAP